MTENIYTEEFITVAEEEEVEENEKDIGVYNYTTDKGSEDQEEVDPFAPIGAVVMEPSGGDFVAKDRYDPNEVKKEEPEEKKQDVTSKEMVWNKPAEEKKPLKKVLFSGPFGDIKAGYLDIYSQGVYLILVEDINAEFSYAPPVSDEELQITVSNKSYKVISPGINMELPNQNIKVTVLLKTGEEDE